MKKVKYLILTVMFLFMAATKVNAEAWITTSSSTVTSGKNFTVYLHTSNTAAWNLHVTASGPVSGCVINQADVSADLSETNPSFQATCTATGTGAITITLTGDTTNGSGVTQNVSGTATVTAVAPSGGGSGGSGGGGSGGGNNNNQPKKSQNNNLSKLEVEGHSLTGEGTNYTLTVSNMTERINIIATPEDGKASVTGAGEKELNVGVNTFEIIVTAENGSKKTYTIAVTRKDDKYYQEDIDDFIASPSDVLLIKEQEEITDDTISKLKNVDKKITIAKVDSNAQVLYSYTLEPKNIESGTVTTISLKSKNNIDELTNYTAGVTVVVDEKIPSNTEFKLKVNYEEGTELNLYKVQNGKLEVTGKVKVENGYVTFNLDGTEEYFLTRATINNENVAVVKKSNSSLLLLITTIVEGIVIVGLIIFIVISLKKKGTKEVEKIDSVSSPVSNSVPVSSAISSPVSAPISNPVPNPVPSSVDSYNNAVNSFSPSTNITNNSISSNVSSNAGIPSIQEVVVDDLPKMVEEASSRMITQ